MTASGEPLPSTGRDVPERFVMLAVLAGLATFIGINAVLAVAHGAPACPAAIVTAGMARQDARVVRSRLARSERFFRRKAAVTAMGAFQNTRGLRGSVERNSTI